MEHLKKNGQNIQKSRLALKVFKELEKKIKTCFESNDLERQRKIEETNSNGSFKREILATYENKHDFVAIAHVANSTSFKGATNS